MHIVATRCRYPSTLLANGDKDAPTIFDWLQGIHTHMMNLEHRIEVQCHKLSLSVKLPAKKNQTGAEKTLLKDVTVAFKPGRMTAIMGASGAGKTSLLSLLVSQTKPLMHDDVLYPTMTVYECVMMSAKLRLPDSIPLSEKQARADEIIKLLGLEKARDTIIGTPETKGISGGERKRTAIAMEMIMNPDILFLDEPTSGLDTFAAYNVVSQLKSLAENGKTVVATIHQPASKTFNLFDDLLLLAEGRVIYYGPTQNVLEYLSQLDFECPQYTNPADFLFMDVLNESDTSSYAGPIKVGDVHESTNAKLIRAWNASPLSTQLAKKIELNRDPAVLEKIFANSQKESSSTMSQLSFLIRRAAANAIRNKMVIFVRLAKAIFMGIMIASIYYDLPSKKGAAQTQNRASALFFICTIEMFSSVGNSLFQFAGEKSVFIREYGNGYYGLLPYFLSKSVLEVPLGLFTPFVMVSILYPITGLRPGWMHFLIAVVTAQLMSLVGAAIGLLLGAVFPNFQAAMAIMPAITMPMMIFGGLQVNIKSLPWYFKPMPYLSPVRWAFSVLAQNELAGLKFADCAPGTPCSGDAALAFFSLQNDPSISTSWLMLVLMIVVYSFLGFLALWRVSRR
ncbi:ABC-2 type transporter domain-containing protein [Paramicrosporidium saccamoebae]|uniref:ABC-2 type transporter domain-containing protein n=1 Tax=Paramicrosporidium saccamoebae TaxID=1246581 RepID=A0A2H9TNB8_9FUNG|nr:ABC-2 type transporter domain-containing protein [Paramicrosporidium saccamoebae]